MDDPKALVVAVNNDSPFKLEGDTARDIYRVHVRNRDGKPVLSRSSKFTQALSGGTMARSGLMGNVTEIIRSSSRRLIILMSDLTASGPPSRLGNKQRSADAAAGNGIFYFRFLCLYSSVGDS